MLTYHGLREGTRTTFDVHHWKYGSWLLADSFETEAEAQEYYRNNPEKYDSMIISRCETTREVLEIEPPPPAIQQTLKGTDQ